METDGTGFVHNNGTVTITTDAITKIKEDKFYNLTINSDTASREITLEDADGNNAFKVYGDLTVTSGRLMSATTSDSIDVYGNTYIGANGKCWHDADQATNKITHHGLVTNLGEYKINDETTVKMNGGIRQLGTLTMD